MEPDRILPERAATPTNLMEDWKEHSLRQHVRAASNLQAALTSPVLHSPVGIPFHSVGVADIAQRSSRSIIGGLDWAAPSFASTSSATDILDASNASLLAESGVFSTFDSRKLSREALNAHWNNMPTTIRDAVFGHGEVSADVHKSLDEMFLPALAHQVLSQALPSSGLFAPSNALLRLKLIEAMHSQLDKLHAHEKTHFELRTWLQSMQDFLLNNSNNGAAEIVDFPSAKCTSQLQISQLTDLLRRTSVVFRTDESSKVGDNETRAIECVATFLVHPASENTTKMITSLPRSKKRGVEGDVKTSGLEKHWALPTEGSEPKTITLSCILNTRDSNQLSLKEHHHFQVDLGENGEVSLYSYTYPDNPLIDADSVGELLRSLKARLLDGAPAGDSDVDFSITDTQFLTFLTLVFCPDTAPEFVVRKFARCLEPHH
eukprot:TRINITY_DN15034_c0_g1_i1.p1 TRINITY_DN15034_c0_g1~~TRINITY_DN15034_c0_g1_i1.p1  ORF type:complete len:433 (+),score=88.88 TRINITY_DN15034_c0_g1_i1:57-1355(+)